MIAKLVYIIALRTQYGVAYDMDLSGSNVKNCRDRKIMY